MNFARLMKHMLTPHWIVGGAFRVARWTRSNKR